MSERLRILETLEEERISVEEALARLEALGGEPGRAAEDPAADAPGGPARAEARQAERPVSESMVRVVWQVIFGIGAAVLTGGGLVLGRFYGGEASGGLAWGWVLFVLGVLLMMLGWWLRQAKWLALRVRQRDGTVFALAFPLPVEAAAWGLRVGGRFVPHLDQAEAEALSVAVSEGLSEDGTFLLQVGEGGSGDWVELSIQ